MADTIKITTLAQLKVALQAAKTYIDGQFALINITVQTPANRYR